MSDRPVWRVSSFSGTGGTCVELAEIGPTVAVRNSNHREAATLHLATAVAAGWITSVATGDLDDLT
jgi:hypothetical protein